MNRLYSILLIALGALLAVNQGFTLVLYVSETGAERGSDVLMPLDIPLYLLLILKRPAQVRFKYAGIIKLSRVLPFIFLILALAGEFVAVELGDFRFAYVHLIRAVLVCYCLLTRLQTRNDCQSIMYGLLLGLAFQSLIGFWQWQVGPVQLPFFKIANTWRAAGTVGTANAFGAYLISLLPIAYRASLFLNLKFKMAWLALFAISSGALLATYSRGSWLAFSISMCLFTLIDFKKKILTRKQTGLLIAITIIGLAVINFKYGDVIENRFSGSAESLSGDQKQSRLNLAKDALTVISGRELFGVGLNNYRHYSDKEILGTRIVHNVYLLISAEQGIPSCVIYVLLIGINFFIGYHLLNSKSPFYYHLGAGCLGGLLALVIYDMGAPDYRLIPVLLQHWRALALPIGLYIAEQNEVRLRAIKKQFLRMQNRNQTRTLETKNNNGAQQARY